MGMSINTRPVMRQDYPRTRAALAAYHRQAPLIIGQSKDWVKDVDCLMFEVCDAFAAESKSRYTQKQCREMGVERIEALLSTDDPLGTLRFALVNGPSPLCLESFAGAHPAGQLRSSDSSYLVRLTFEHASELITMIKSRAQLNDSHQPQTGTLSLGDASFRVNYCPQINGEILVLDWQRISRGDAST